MVVVSNVGCVAFVVALPVPEVVWPEATEPDVWSFELSEDSPLTVVFVVVVARVVSIAVPVVVGVAGVVLVAVPVVATGGGAVSGGSWFAVVVFVPDEAPVVVLVPVVPVATVAAVAGGVVVLVVVLVVDAAGAAVGVVDCDARVTACAAPANASAAVRESATGSFVMTASMEIYPWFDRPPAKPLPSAIGWLACGTTKLSRRTPRASRRA
jgi:hypothetical protein